MDVKSRKAQHADATRRALIRVARKLFADRGYADTATEEVVRRARVTRGALYHHFRDKQDLFKAVLHEEEQKLARKIAEAGASERDPWRRLVTGCRAFLDACLDPAIQRILLLDAPSVLGWEGRREIEAAYYLEGFRQALSAAMDAGSLERQPVDPLAHILLGALNEAALLIAQAENQSAARNQASAVITRLLNGLAKS